MITISQFKAARSLLDWTQAELAKAAGLSTAVIANLEQGKGGTRPSTQAAITRAFEQAGVEFTPDPGVRLRQEKFALRTFEGRESVFNLWLDIEHALAPSGGGEVLISGVDENIWLQKYKAEIGPALRRQQSMKIFNRLLVAEGSNTVLIGPEPYRAIPKALFQQTPYFVYADRFAIINWGPPQSVTIIQNPLVAETFRRQFDFNYHQLGRPLRTENLVIAALPD